MRSTSELAARIQFLTKARSCHDIILIQNPLWKMYVTAQCLTFPASVRETAFSNLDHETGYLTQVFVLSLFCSAQDIPEIIP